MWGFNYGRTDALSNVILALVMALLFVCITVLVVIPTVDALSVAQDAIGSVVKHGAKG